MKRLALLALVTAAGIAPAAAQQIDLGAIGQADGTTIGYIIQMFGLLTVLSIAPLLAEAISRIHQGESVSALFVNTL